MFWLWLSLSSSWTPTRPKPTNHDHLDLTQLYLLSSTSLPSAAWRSSLLTTLKVCFRLLSAPDALPSSSTSFLLVLRLLRLAFCWIVPCIHAHVSSQGGQRTQAVLCTSCYVFCRCLQLRWRWSSCFIVGRLLRNCSCLACDKHIQ